jgi:hypothetical protein
MSDIVSSVKDAKLKSKPDPKLKYFPTVPIRILNNYSKK